MAQNNKDKAAAAEVVETAAAEVSGSHLVELTMAGESIFAHPTQVQLWVDQGWTAKG